MSASRGESKTPDTTDTTLSLGETKEDRSSHFIFQPSQSHMIASFLDAKSTVRLFACLRSLNQKTTEITHWKDKLITMGFPEKPIKEVITAKVIRDYKKLFKNLSRVFPSMRKDIGKFGAWEIICFSGEPDAMQHFFQEGKLTKEAGNTFWMNPLHLAALSGSVEAIKWVIEVLGIPPSSTVGVYNYNALHLATWSGSIAAIRYLRILSNESNLGLEFARDINGHNALMHAYRRSKNLTATLEIFNLPIDRIINPPDPYENYWRAAKVVSSLAAGATVGYLKGMSVAGAAITVYGVSAATFIGVCTMAGAGLLLLMAYCINCYRTGYSGFFSSVLARHEQPEMKQERLIMAPSAS